MLKKEEIQKSTFVKMHANDNVLVALVDLQEGEKIYFNENSIQLREKIKAKHKVSIQDLSVGDNVIMYGVLVGKVKKNIPAGYALTIGNVEHAAANYAYRKTSFTWQAPVVSKFKNKTFKGYKRNDGRTGTANYCNHYAKLQ